MSLFQNIAPLCDQHMTMQDAALADILHPLITGPVQSTERDLEQSVAYRIATEYAQARFMQAQQQAGVSPGVLKTAFLMRAGFRVDEL